MTSESRRLAGILMIVLPTVAIGGVSILTLLINDPAYAENELRQDLWRAGHAHAGVLLLLALILLRYVDEMAFSKGWKAVARSAVPTAAILMPLGFFLSVLTPDATEPNAMIYFTYAGGLLLMFGLVVNGVGLLKTRAPAGE
ncbi:hypothetical protein BH23BAC4_BH23BAC4_10790 [soil metagenome]